MTWISLGFLIFCYLVLPPPSDAQISPEASRAEKERDFCDAARGIRC